MVGEGLGFEDKLHVDRFFKSVNESNISRVIWKTTSANRKLGTKEHIPQFDTEMCQQELLKYFNITGWIPKVSKE